MASSATSTTVQSENCIEHDISQSRQGSPVVTWTCKIREKKEEEGVWVAACSLQAKNTELVNDVIDVVKSNR